MTTTGGAGLGGGSGSAGAAGVAGTNVAAYARAAAP